ncbi:MAG: hypothetical protein M3441_17740 [Chloroflexota bacterium]|nr:hypothetical protein [Chloroflexota bacterium]
MNPGQVSNPRGDKGIWQGLVAAIIAGVFLLWANGRFDNKPGDPTPVPTIAVIQPDNTVVGIPSATVPREAVKPNTPNEPVLLKRIHVPGNSSRGTEYNVERSGRYLFRYVSGAYSTNAPDVKDTWLTAVLIFKNNGVEWDGERIRDEVALKFADHQYHPSQEEAQNAAETNVESDILEVDYSSGDRLTFVAVDSHSYYTDNPGEVLVEIYFRDK